MIMRARANMFMFTYLSKHHTITWLHKHARMPTARRSQDLYNLRDIKTEKSASPHPCIKIKET